MHAKCYLNEKMALVTSMNLYDYSMIKNLEMGVLVVLRNKTGFFDSSFEDDDLYQTIRNQAVRIMNQSESAHAPEKSASVRQGAVTLLRQRERLRDPRSKQSQFPEMGLCIQMRQSGIDIQTRPNPILQTSLEIWN